MKILIIFICFLIGKSHAKSYYKKNIVDKAHRSFSKKILKLSDNIDGFFADSKHDDIENRSKLTISLDTYFREGRGPYAIPELNYRLVLPRTEKRLQVFIESEDKDKETEIDESQAKTNPKSKDNDDDLTAGLRYMIEKSGINLSTDTGVLVNMPVVVFARFTAKKKVTFTNWVLKINEQVKWVNDEGFTSDLDLDFDKRLSKNLVLRMVNNTFWNDEDYIIRFENGPSLFQKINQKMALSYHAHVITFNEPSFVVEQYVLQVTYKQRLYKKWLFMQMTPYINFPRQRNFHRTPGFVLGFEAIAGHL